jgi:hypothetical protein
VQEGSFGKKSPTLIHPPPPLSVVGVSNRLKFEQLKMNEDETISKYFLRVEELVNAMKGLGETV